MIRGFPFALRTLVRAPAFTAVVVATLGLGVGATTAIFSIVHAVVLRPLDYPDPGQLVRVTSELRGFGATDTGVTVGELADYQARTDLFSGVVGIEPVSANATIGDTPERVEVMLVGWNYFSVLGVQPALGRVFDRDDDTPGVAKVAVVSESFWRRMGADPQAIGRMIVIDDDRVRVVGVMPPGFTHPGGTLQGNVDVWSPAGFGGAAAAAARSRRGLEGALARLQPGVTIEQVQAQLAEYGASVQLRFPSEWPAQSGWHPLVVPLQDDVVGGVAAPMFVLLSGVGLLLLVVCVNVAHLVLARASGRRREIAIRWALGAGMRPLAALFAAESTLLAGVGGAFGLLLALWAVHGLTALAPDRVPRLDDVAIDGTAVAVTVGICAAATLLFALVPLLQARRTDMFAAVNEGGPGRGTDVRGSRVRGALVVSEVAMATVLLVGAGLLVRTVVGLLDVPVGFETDHLLTARVGLPQPDDRARARYLDPARRVEFYADVLERVRALPGVDRAAVSSQIPMGGWKRPLFVEFQEAATGPIARPVMHDFQVSPGYFDTMGVRIVRGRPFGQRDRAGSAPVAIVSETAALRLWKDRDPLGQRVRLAPDLPWMTIVGVAADVVLNTRLTEAPQPILYQPLDQSSDLSMALLVRTAGATPGLGESLARAVRAVDPDLPIYSVRTMSDLIESAVAQRRFLMRLLVAFGVIATALALLGIYGVMAYSVSQRRREIGIRIAIGATARDVSRMAISRALGLAVAGVVAGIAASQALARLIESQFFGIRAWDPLTLACVLALMIALATVAAYLPARRAGRVDPVAALK